jgi:outer membrane immunogenic protein
MRTCIAAFAAILMAAPAVADGARDSWTGGYVGIHGGYAWGDATTRDDPADWGTDPKWIGPFPYNVDGAFGGGTAGYNFQVGSLVLGPEADVGYLNLDGSRRTTSDNPTKYQTLAVDGGMYALLGGRVGFAFGKTLVYGKGGWVWFDTEATQTTTNPGYKTNGTGSYNGLAYGGGLEQALGGGWSIKAEYMHFDFGEEQGDQTSITDPPVGHVYENWTELDTDTVKFGINYSFSGF